MKTAEDIVKDKKSEIVSVSYDQTVQQACQLMVAKKIGAILVKKDGNYVGIWTERDLLRNFTAPDFDPNTARIGDYMTTRLHSVSHDTPLHKIEEMFLGLFVRHLPVYKERITPICLFNKNKMTEYLTSTFIIRYSTFDIHPLKAG